MAVMRNILLLLQNVRVVLASFLSALPAIEPFIMFLLFPVEDYTAHGTVEGSCGSSSSFSSLARSRFTVHEVIGKKVSHLGC